MSNRLDQEREKLLQPKRIRDCYQELVHRGFKCEADDTKIVFMFNGNKIQFYPYSGWHTGKGIKDGRGFQNLLRQLKDSHEE